MRLFDLRVNQLNNPLGYDMSYISLSWRAESENSSCYEAVQITVREENEDTFIFDSGVMKDYRKPCFTLPITLKPRTRYYWKVWAQGNAGDETVSEECFFETGKMSEAWEAKWIATKEDVNRMPILYKYFPIKKSVKKARLYIYGLGLYEAYLNGEKLGDEFLQPGYHSYDSFMEYQTLDVTKQLTEGVNCLSVLLGEGWYKGRFGFDGDFRNLYGDRKMCIGELRIVYTDDSEDVIVSDSSWSGKQSHVLQNNIYDGEWIDESKECAELSVSVVEGYTKLLKERTNPQIKKTKSFATVTESWQEDGTLLLDFGEEITGWVEWSGVIPKGCKVQLQYGEVLQEGLFYRDNLRTAKAEFVYISDGEYKTVRPHFTYYGFRYVLVSGVDAAVKPQFTAYRLVSDTERTGWITTSNDKLNVFVENTRRSQLCNFLDIPTDCPQRDERMGWTGDVAIFARSACFHEDCAAFFRHYADCVRAEQNLLGGMVPFFAPRVKIPEREGLNPFYNSAGACGWADVATILPWTLYEHYGNLEMLAQQYPMMCDWVDYITKTVASNAVPYLWQNGFHLGDWLALDNGNIHNPIGKTDMHLIASVYYYLSVSYCYSAAVELGDARKDEFAALLANIKNAFIGYYFSEVGEPAFELTQTACALLLNAGLYPTGGEARLAKMLADLLDENGGKLNTGFLGTPVLCPTLSENGYNNLAYDLLLNEDYPGWLHEVNLGATTVWERWNSLEDDGRISGTGMNSLNHYAYGSVVEWMYKYMCGFRPKMGDSICMEICPMPNTRIHHAEGHFVSMYGEFISAWQYQGDEIVYKIVVPFNARAKVVFPNGECAELTSGEYTFRDTNGVVVMDKESMR